MKATAIATVGPVTNSLLSVLLLVGMAGCTHQAPVAWQYTSVQAADGLYAERCVPATSWHDLLQQPPSLWAEFRKRTEGPRLVICHRKGMGMPVAHEEEIPIFALVAGKPTRRYRMVSLKGGHVWLGSPAFTNYVAEQLLEGHDVQLALSASQPLISLVPHGFKKAWKEMSQSRSIAHSPLPVQDMQLSNEHH